MRVHQPTNGQIIGRNGTFRIRTVVFWTALHGEVVYIDALGKRGTIIRGGIEMETAALERLATDFLKERGFTITKQP